MRALVVSPYLYPEGGGLERYAHHVGVELEKLGVSLTSVGHARESFRDENRVGVEPAFRLSNTPLHPRFARVVRDLIRESRPDVVHAHSPVPGAAELAWWAARKEGVPFVVTYHAGALLSGSPLFSLPARLHANTIERAMLSRAHGRIAVSRFVAERVCPDLSWRIAPPGVDSTRFSPGGSPVAGRVLFVGPASRSYAWKGLDVLVEAVRRVRGARLRVVGDGDLADRFRALGVDVVGRVSEERLVREYREASVVVLPSVTDAESFGMVLAEANACGRPVIGSRVGGIPCFVREGENGLLVKPRSVSDLATAIGLVLNNDSFASALGARGRALVEREHQWGGVARVTLDALVTAASSSGRRRRIASRAATPRWLQ